MYGSILTPLSQEDKVFSYNTLEYTPQNKLTYIRARYYDSSNGTFLSKDTYLGNIYNPTTTNRYAYCSGDPINNTDQDGHLFGLIAAIVAVVVVVVVAVSKPSTSTTRTNPSSGGGSSSRGSSGGSTGGNKNTSTGGGSRGYTGGGSSGGGSGGSSGGGSSDGGYVYIPDPRQYYYPIITGPYCVNNNSHYYTYNELNSNKSIKELTLNSPYGYNSQLTYSTYNYSNSEKENLANNTNKSRTTNSFGEVISDIAYYAMLAEPYLKAAKTIFHLVPVPYLTPIVDGLNALADGAILLDGAINTGKAISNLSNDNISTYDKVSGLILGIGETALGAYGLNSDILDIKQDINNSQQQNSSGLYQDSKGYYQDNNGKWHRPNGQFASNTEVGLSNNSEHYLNRPYIRKETIDAVNAKTIINQNTGEIYDSISKKWVASNDVELGHTPGNEFAYYRDFAESQGWTQAQFNDYMNNPEFYAWQDIKSNRSHFFEVIH